MYLIDTHAHIYLPEFDADREACLEAAERSGIGSVLMPAIDASTHNLMLQVEKNHPLCLSMIGLHPCSVKENFEDELKEVSHHLDQRPFIAIGEIGLDFYWDRTFTDQQYQAFHRQIQLAIEKDLPIVIHSRDATDECIEVVEAYPGLRGVFHCFSGNTEQARKIMDTGFFLGIGGVVTFKNAGLDKVIRETGLSQVILETDAPYLAPVPFRGKRNQPAYVKLVAEKLSSILELTVEEIAATTTANAKKLFRLA
jgi:TatD DNase family protein